MAEGVEAFLDALYQTDRDSHRLVNQAILVLERNCPAEDASGSTIGAGASYPTVGADGRLTSMTGFFEQS